MLRGHAAQHALAIWHLYCDRFDGGILARRGDAEEGARRLRAAVNEIRRSGFVHYLTVRIGVERGPG